MHETNLIRGISQIIIGNGETCTQCSGRDAGSATYRSGVRLPVLIKKGPLLGLF
jgi:hypothetical protein